jgi:poly-gamma-glutamate capsule biosynthesis protein CapA/YwtB (metallophosphatase superfamily)
MTKAQKSILIVAGAGALFSFFLLFPSKQSNAQNALKTAHVQNEAILEDTLITLVAVGDMMLGTNFPNESYLPEKNSILLEPLHDVLQNADITFGNLEGTVLNSGGNVKKCSDPSKCYAFRQPEYVVEQLKNAGFSFLSIANNHLGDFGDVGRENTMRILREKGIRYAGLVACPWDTLTVKGITVGMTAFAPNTGCLQINDYKTLQTVVKQLKQFCQIVIVSFHGGAEGSGRTNITRKNELFYGEDRGNVYEFARVAIDAGADVVLGHGPHVTRAIDFYKGKFISYSMGNFCTYGRFNLNGVSGIAPVFKLQLTKNGEFVSGKVISTKQLGEGGPLLDETNGALEQIKKLTKMDIPELQINFRENGEFDFQKNTPNN